MSKLKSSQDYEKTFSFKFLRWMKGTKDPYVNVVEMKPQKEHEAPDVATAKQRSDERLAMIDDVYNIRSKTNKRYMKIYRAFAIISCIILCIALVVNVSYLPPIGDATNPTNNEVTERYIEHGMEETGAVNIVAGMILTYRAFDTFGETNVLFIATCCVMILLMLEEKVLEKQEVENDRKYEPKHDPILEVCAKVLCPVIFLFGIYVILNGHISPGGGFSGGAIIGAGLILYVCAFGFKKTQRFFNEEIYKVAKVTALCMYGLIGTYFYICGANGWNNHIPLGTPGAIISAGIIMPINVCVGLEVACTMYAFYALFRRGGL